MRLQTSFDLTFRGDARNNHRWKWRCGTDFGEGNATIFCGLPQNIHFQIRNCVAHYFGPSSRWFRCSTRDANNIWVSRWSNRKLAGCGTQIHFAFSYRLAFKDAGASGKHHTNFPCVHQTITDRSQMIKTHCSVGTSQSCNPYWKLGRCEPYRKWGNK